MDNIFYQKMDQDLRFVNQQNFAIINYSQDVDVQHKAEKEIINMDINKEKIKMEVKKEKRKNRTLEEKKAIRKQQNKEAAERYRKKIATKLNSLQEEIIYLKNEIIKYI